MGRRTSGGSLWITRMGDDGDDFDVATIHYAGDGAWRTFEHGRRVIRCREQAGAALLEGDLLLTLLDADGDSVGDPYRIPAAQADWFLDVWLQVPAAWRIRGAVHMDTYESRPGGAGGGE